MKRTKINNEKGPGLAHYKKLWPNFLAAHAFCFLITGITLSDRKTVWAKIKTGKRSHFLNSLFSEILSIVAIVAIPSFLLVIFFHWISHLNIDKKFSYCVWFTKHCSAACSSKATSAAALDFFFLETFVNLFFTSWCLLKRMQRRWHIHWSLGFRFHLSIANFSSGNNGDNNNNTKYNLLFRLSLFLLLSDCTHYTIAAAASRPSQSPMNKRLDLRWRWANGREGDTKEEFLHWRKEERVGSYQVYSKRPSIVPNQRASHARSRGRLWRWRWWWWWRRRRSRKTGHGQSAKQTDR